MSGETDKAMTLRITQEQHDKLSTIAKVEGISIVECIRVAIDRYLTSRRHQLEPMGMQGMRRCAVCREIEPDVNAGVCPKDGEGEP
ncbi:MAG: hypothetical protein ABFE07_00540 [Armatimonadia bacterium]